MSAQVEIGGTWTTYRREDGIDVFGEYGWVTDFPEEEAENTEGPVAIVEEVWVLQHRNIRYAVEPPRSCEIEDAGEECEEDPTAWVRFEVDGPWMGACARHQEAVVELVQP